MSRKHKRKARAAVAAMPVTGRLVTTRARSVVPLHGQLRWGLDPPAGTGRLFTDALAVGEHLWLCREIPITRSVAATTIIPLTGRLTMTGPKTRMPLRGTLRWGL